jgi:putative transposase
MASGKKNAEDLGAYLVFIDESGFLLIPTVRRTWAVKGETPILKHHYKHEKVSVISALTVSPKRNYLGLYFKCLPGGNFDNVAVVEFLRYLLKHLPGHIIVIWDNGSCHKGDAMREFLTRCTRLHLVALPAYAPELNPDEGVWNQIRNTMENGRPDNQMELTEELNEVLQDLALSQGSLRWCFHQCELPFFLA